MRTAFWTLVVGLMASMLVAAQRGGTFTGSREHQGIRYSTATLQDPIARLSQQIDQGTVRLTFDPDHGYLRSVLDALRVPIASQVLVFGQTSKQGELISAKNPRALFFNDAAAVGWVRGADQLELAAVDPVAGAVFYTIDQRAGDRPVIKREQDECLLCHQTWDTLGVPGWVTMSVFSVPEDKYSYASGAFSDHRSPFNERWGGWFVTGRLGNMRHLGNETQLARPANRVAPVARSLDSLDGMFDMRGFPSAHSDVVALMLLEHQSTMINLITRTGWEARVAPGGTKVTDAAVELVDYLLFVDESPLPVPITGSSDFTRVFAEQGPKDKMGRSFRQLDLKTRLLRYPCSYMIHSEAFARMPAAAKTAVYERLWHVLTGREAGEPYNRLSREDRSAIVEILRDTQPDLPAYFNEALSR